MLGGVGVPSADIFVLQGFELLLCAEFVGLEGGNISIYVGECDLFGSADSYHFVKWSGWFASRLVTSLGSCPRRLVKRESSERATLRQLNVTCQTRNPRDTVD